MAHVTALYRYPIKGFTPEPMTELIVQPDGRIQGDRVFAFRFARAAHPDSRDGLDYWPKAKGLSLQDFPSLANLKLQFIEADQRVTLRAGTGQPPLFDEPLTKASAEQFRRIVTDYVLASPEGRKLQRPGRLPLKLVGDGHTSRFQDRPLGYVTVHSEASVRQLGNALGMTVDDRRFRSNIVIEGCEADAELGWTGQVRIGEVQFQPHGAIVRCLATHANPDTGVRDAPVLTTLTRDLGMSEPCLGRLLLPFEMPQTGVAPGSHSTGFAGGVIRIGDSVTLEAD